MAVVYSLNNYHSVPDHADFTLPNGDWAWLLIVRPDQATGGQDILSTGEWGVTPTYNFYQFDTDFGLKVNGLTDATVGTVSAGSWRLLVGQRSGSNLSLRSVNMGATTVTNSGNVTIATAVNPTSSLMMGRRSDTGANPFIGALSDAMFMPGQTISDADMQAIATGTAIDSFAWYSSRTFWNIASTSTGTDQTGNHTVTVNGTLSSTADPVQLVRFGVITQTITQVVESDISQAFTGRKIKSAGQIIELDIAQDVTSKKSVSASQVTELDIAQPVLALQQRFINRIDEVDTAGIVRRNPLLVASVTESNISQSVTSKKAITVGQVAELDIIQPVTVIKSITQVIETDVSQIFTAENIKSIGQVTELNMAQDVIKIGGAAPFVLDDNEGVRVIVDNLIRTATLSATTTASGFDINNIKLADKSKIWRSTAITKQEITMTWASAQALGGLGIAFSNLTVGSVVRIRFYTLSSDPQQAFNTEETTINFAPEPPVGYNTIGYLSFPYGGGNYFSTFFEPTSVEKIVVEITSAGNPDGYIEVGSIVVGPTLSFTSGVDYSATLDIEERSEHTRSSAGDLRTLRGTQNKILNLTMGKLTPNDNLLINKLNRGIGKSVPVFVSALSDSATESKKNMWQAYGRINNDINLSPVLHNRASSTIKIQEI